MYLTNNLIVASLFVIASSFVNAAATSPLTAVNSQEDFCLFLPPQPGLNIRETENDSIPFCTKKDTVPKASEFPEGFITTAHFLKSDDYVQVTGFFDRSKYNLAATDIGGQYDNHAKGRPVHAQCKDYKYFVSLIEPEIERFCIRCCNDKNNCITGRSGYGCLRVVDGDYNRDNNFISTGDNTESSSHQNFSIDSVYTDLDALPSKDTASVDTSSDNKSTTTTDTTDTTSNANQEIAAEIESLKTELSNSSVEQVQTKWNDFASELSSRYPQVSEQIKKLSAITTSLTTAEQWNTFMDLVSEKIIQLQGTATSTSSEATSSTHTDSKEDLEWLFNHRNSHDNQATW